MQRALKDLLDRLPDDVCWWVAFSGGLDSTVLLHCLHDYCRARPGPELRAIHVDHGLQASSAEMAGHCQRHCKALRIPLSLRQVRVNARGHGPEASAREARYRAFDDQMQPGDLLFTAHHASDQVENVLLRLLRGTGIEGMASMGEIAGLPFCSSARALGDGESVRIKRVVRPLLACTREQLQDFAKNRELDWIDDPSNQDPRFDRNFLRQHITPPLRRRWPALHRTIGRFVRSAAESRELLAELAAIDAGTATGCDVWGAFVHRQPLKEMAEPRVRNLLRYWLRRFPVPLPNHATLREISRQLSQSGADHASIAWAHVSLRGHAGRMYLVDERQLAAIAASCRAAAGHSWYPGSENPASPLCSSAKSVVSARPATGAGRATPGSAEARLLRAGAYRLAFRQGGERCMVNGVRRTVKALLREAGVPVWLRNCCPLLLVDDEVAAIGDQVIADHFVSTDGYCLEWNPHGTWPKPGVQMLQ